MLQTTQKKYKFNNKLIITIFFLIFISGLGIFAYKNNLDIFNINRLNMDKKADIKSKFKIAFAPIEKPDIITYKDNLLYITDKKIKAINLMNKVEFELLHELNNTSVICDDKYILIWEKNGTKLSVYENDKLVFKKDILGLIKNAKLINGHVLVSTTENNINRVLAYDSNSNLVLSKDYLEDEYIVDFDYSKDLGTIVVLSLLTRSDKISSKIDYFNIRNTYQVNSIPIVSSIKKDLLASNIKVFGENNVILVADNQILSLNDLGNDNWNKDFSDAKLHYANISSGKYIVLELSELKYLFVNKRKIVTLDGNGQDIGNRINIKMPIKDININENFYLISDFNKIYSISNGTLIMEHTIKNVERIRAIDKSILLVRKDSLEIIEAN